MTQLVEDQDVLGAGAVPLGVEAAGVVVAHDRVDGQVCAQVLPGSVAVLHAAGSFGSLGVPVFSLCLVGRGADGVGRRVRLGFHRIDEGEERLPAVGVRAAEWAAEHGVRPARRDAEDGTGVGAQYAWVDEGA
jgi:hypothetical protein